MTAADPVAVAHRHAHLPLPVGSAWLLLASLVLLFWARYWLRREIGAPVLLWLQYVTAASAALCFLLDLAQPASWLQRMAAVALTPAVVSMLFNLMLSRLPESPGEATALRRRLKKKLSPR